MRQHYRIPHAPDFLRNSAVQMAEEVGYEQAAERTGYSVDSIRRWARHPAEFRHRVVALALEQGSAVAARTYDVSEVLINRWRGLDVDRVRLPQGSRSLPVLGRIR